jgi:MFS family permease
MSLLNRLTAVEVFLSFSFAYFLSALIRAITATLSPTLTSEFMLGASDLGLLAAGYFLGFAATQIPMGNWLDRYGPKKVILCFLSVALIGCLAFSRATSFGGLLLARVLCGVGVSACLMAPLTGYRRWLEPVAQLRANSWMLMTGSMGMVASTLPVQWLMPYWGWRPMFYVLAALVLLAMFFIAWRVPTWRKSSKLDAQQLASQGSYTDVLKHPYFQKMAPLGFFNYGGLLSIQTLWAVPWMIRVAGYTPVEAATGLFWINIAMLLAFWTWGMMNPALARRGLNAEKLIRLGIPLSLLAMAALVLAGGDFPQWTALLLALFCTSSTFVSLAQPAVALAFPPELAGRALSAYNLIIFSGVFVVQWSIGLMIDGLKALGATELQAFQGALAVQLLSCTGAYVYFIKSKVTAHSVSA